MKLAGAALVVIALLVVAGCGDDDDAEPGPEVRVVSLNILHGNDCPGSDACDRVARVDLFLGQLAAAACPEIVALQEVDPPYRQELDRQLADTCDGAYEVVTGGPLNADSEAVLTTLEVTDKKLQTLASESRTALRVELVAPIGPVVVVVTHLASDSDNPSCILRNCAPPCTEDMDTRTCQAIEVAELLEDALTPEAVGIVAGDLNAAAGDPAIQAFTERGWIDSHLEAGNPECDPNTGEQCTSGRADLDMSDLTDPTSQENVRVDYLLVAPPDGCEPTFGEDTGLFNAEPAEGDLAFPSDHVGILAEVSCPT